MSKMLHPDLAAALLAAAPIDHTVEDTTTDTREEVTMTEPEPTGDHAAALTDILKRMKGVRATGEQFVDAYIDKVWQGTKLSKIEAARQGLVASEHNRDAWKALQTLRGEMKAAVRTKARESAHVAPKVAKHTAAKAEAAAIVRTPEVDALLLQHAADPAVQALAQLLGL